MSAVEKKVGEEIMGSLLLLSYVTTSDDVPCSRLMNSTETEPMGQTVIHLSVSPAVSKNTASPTKQFRDATPHLKALWVAAALHEKVNPLFQGSA